MMTDTKISQLTDGGTITSGDLIPIARAGQNYSINGATPFSAFNNDVGDRWVADYPNTAFPKYIGYIYTSPISVVEAAITASGYNTETPTTFAVEYSDNTTTGLDGTWTQTGPTYTTT